MADSSLTAIRTKVRRLTRSPSSAQISDAQIDEYVNTFVLYDFPEHLRLFSLRTTFNFATNPGQDEYPTDTNSFAGVTTNPLYNFQNLYITTHQPVYIAGYQSLWSQSREQFFGIYPRVRTIQNTGLTGTGGKLDFTGTVPSAPGLANPTGQNTVLLQGNVLIDSIDTNGNGLAMVDVPVVSLITGNKTQNGNLYPIGQQPATPPTVIDATNTINYATGLFTVTFPTAPANGIPINSQTVPSVIGIPQALLYYDNTFTVRPVPDQPYIINIEVYKRPTELLNQNQEPQLQQWWQYIAYGAAKKIFEDRMDLDSVQMIMPEYKKQEALVLRTTIVQQTKERTFTIYTDQIAGQYGAGFFYGGGNF